MFRKFERTDYPRPQLRRRSWINLNGQWNFFVGGKACGTISVPYCPECVLSGVDKSVTGEDFSELRYERTVTLGKIPENRRLLLHFGAVDQVAEVFINGTRAGSHEGGYTAFTLDVTALVHEGENLLTVEVKDPLSHDLPWGKQKKNHGGMWYTPVSGIWQTVWAEIVPKRYIRSLRIENENDIADIYVDIAGGSPDDENEPAPVLTLSGKEISVVGGHARFQVPGAIFWTPEDPVLYDFRVSFGEDLVESYLAFRSLSVENVNGVPRLSMDGVPYFFHGVLDQGYYEGGLYTPEREDRVEQDITALKKLRFNMLRKHIKVEPENFYYDCDRLGMAVFQDMVQTGEYSFFRDTLLPTIGITRLSDRRRKQSEKAKEHFLRAMEETVCQLRNHPCIVLWTIFNEGWGQFSADEAYEKLKALDSTRWIDATSGWFWQKKSDVDSYHIYFKKLRMKNLKPGAKRPQILSEYGGYVYRDPLHKVPGEKLYGYKTLRNQSDYQDALRALKAEVEELRKKGLSAAVYTQLSDVEEEANGLFSADRKVNKAQSSMTEN